MSQKLAFWTPPLFDYYWYSCYSDTPTLKYIPHLMPPKWCPYFCFPKSILYRPTPLSPMLPHQTIVLQMGDHFLPKKNIVRTSYIKWEPFSWYLGDHNTPKPPLYKITNYDQTHTCNLWTPHDFKSQQHELKHLVTSDKNNTSSNFTGTLQNQQGKA